MAKTNLNSKLNATLESSNNKERKDFELGDPISLRSFEECFDGSHRQCDEHSHGLLPRLLQKYFESQTGSKTRFGEELDHRPHYNFLKSKVFFLSLSTETKDG